MEINFETMAYKAGLQIFQISENNIIIVRGIYMSEAITYFCDNNISAISYPYTGVFILFKGRRASSLGDKYKQYIDADRKTKREIIFQNRNAAAQFVLGNKGTTDNWE